MRLAFAAFVLALPSAFGQATDPTIPVDAKPRQTVEGRGVQVYRCVNRDGALQWASPVPDAKLFAAGTQRQLGTHSEGPTWTWVDGSAVRGRVAQRLSSPDPASVPWLLLSAEPAPGTQGALTNVAWVRRSETHGGAPPANGCDASHHDAVVRIPYTATYTFYSAR